MEDTRPLASLSLTHVYYDPDDPLSLVCAWLALLPQALCIVYVTLIWSTREVEIALMFAGQLGCEAINFALKRLIKEERPRRIHGKGYGMPSSHAQFVAYWSVFLVLFLMVRHRPSPARLHHRPYSLVERVTASGVALVTAAAVAWSRIYLNYHTEKQVLVGCLAGATTAVGWFIVTAAARQVGLLSWGLQTPIARLFRFRDLVVEEDPCQSGWDKWEERKVEAEKKKAK
ncbi:putative dolichyldiphosphatase [Colletotrichum spinosum]|uniref:Dolichyldiphosphatase n=1 Tax=Colletotrichum spinosum TaxID=1347390 RepID=A0A4R8Q096_9PEZI|nr:putative dolichyldiphosphatase [Colletotrichum spinosum]